MQEKTKDKNIVGEFDLFAANYNQLHKDHTGITGEEPDYFAHYKLVDFAQVFKGKTPPSSILDFGSGIGNSIPHFRKYFPQAKLFCADVSDKSLDIAQKRFPGDEVYLKIDDSIPVFDESFDAVYTACVFHHIPHSEHVKWIDDINRVLKSNGMLFLYEHNPLNPLTVRTVKNCPLDVNARLIRAGVMKKLLLNNGWRDVKIEYKVFFPAALQSIRFLEKHMKSIFIGAQWRITAIK